MRRTPVKITFNDKYGNALFTKLFRATWKEDHWEFRDYVVPNTTYQGVTYDPIKRFRGETSHLWPNNASYAHENLP